MRHAEVILSNQSEQIALRHTLPSTNTHNASRSIHTAVTLNHYNCLLCIGAYHPLEQGTRGYKHGSIVDGYEFKQSTRIGLYEPHIADL